MHRALISASAIALGIVCVIAVPRAFTQSVSAAVPAGAPQRLSGTLGDGTPWLIQMPANWNGTLLLDLDAAGFAARPGAPPVQGPARAYNDWLLAQGYALAGTTREPVGYDFPRAVENLLQVRRFLIDKWGMPRRTLASGMSRGAFVVRKCLELHPEIFDGGVMSAGGGAGEIAVLNNKLNGLFVLKTLVDPAAPLKLVNIDPQAEQQALNALLAKASATPQGRARLALAAAVQQFALWSNRAKPRPEASDYEAQVDQIADSFGFGAAVPVRAGVERIAGGNVSWNTGVDYGKLLHRSGRGAMIEALYARAGLTLREDLATLARAPRITADPDAVRRAEPLMTYTGRIADPLVNVDNDDPVDPASDKLAYLHTLNRAGAAKDFRLIWADVAGHAAMTDLDRAVAFRLLIRRIDSGRWDDTSVRALRQMAAELAQSSPVDLGRSTLFDPGRLPAPSQTWDVSNWGSYSGR